MRAIALMYHDVFDDGGPDATGMPGSAAARYKLDRDSFVAHVRALTSHARLRLNDITRLLDYPFRDPPPVVITFDDGGVSAYTRIADLLEEDGWRGHFMVTAGWVGRPTFLSPPQIRELRDRGHVIGSHSFSHPTRMSACSPDQVAREWRDSVARLSDILGEPVRVASVPGGYYAPHVAEPLAALGVTSLFTSEPTTRCWQVNGCTVLGRFTVWRHTPVGTVAALAAGRMAPRMAQAVAWNARRVAKTVAGDTYLAVQRRILGA